jgi:hypothetical protein
MRVLVLLSLALLTTAAPAKAASVPASAVQFAERSALLAADTTCKLLSADARAALTSAAAQARGALLRSGWSMARADRLGARAADEGRARACDDPALATAVASATIGFEAWNRLPAMDFPGGERVWRARRTPDPDGFYLRQDLPNGAALGVTAEGLTLLVPRGEAAPSAARLHLRDPVRAPTSAVDVPGRTATGLAAAVPPRSGVRIYWASARQNVKSATSNRTDRVAFVFPKEAAAALTKLDPREAVEIEIDQARHRDRALAEVGDFAAAVAFVRR